VGGTWLNPTAAAAVLGVGKQLLRDVVERDKRTGSTCGPPAKWRRPPAGWAVRADILLGWLALAAETGRLGPPRA
jgi:hypothetical protein